MIIEELLQRLENITTNEEMSLLLDHDPPKEWLKEHPQYKGHLYLPIEKVEMLLSLIFKANRKVQVVNVTQLFNSISVTVRVHFLDFSGVWLWHDGVGADNPAIGTNTVAGSLPAAKSLAICDACDHLGRLFGRDLNRDVVPEKSDQGVKELFDELYELGKIPAEYYERFNQIIETKELASYNKLKKQLLKLKES